MRRIFRNSFHAALGLLPPGVAVNIHYFVHHKRIPNTRNPRRFTEKIIRRKIFERDLRMPLLADKISAKDFVAEKLGPGFVTPTLWSGSRLPPRDQRTWPLPYVIKANNGSGANIFIRKPSDIDWPAIEEKTASWLRTSHARWAGEWAYTQINPKILVEPYIGGPSSLPVDYKFYLFDGRVHYVAAITDEATEPKRTFFDRNWKRQEFSLGYMVDRRVIVPPTSLARMIDAAETLGKDFAFVRIDFYEVDGEPRFSEFTFYPDSGIKRFNPDKYDFIFGALWK